MLFRAIISLLSVPGGLPDDANRASGGRRRSTRGKRDLLGVSPTNRWGSFRDMQQPVPEPSGGSPGVCMLR